MRSRLAVGALAIDPGGRVHLLVCDRADPPVPAGAREVTLERWTVRAGAGGGWAPADGDVVFASKPDLLARLRDRLGNALIGLRLYAAGSESFLADIACLADRAGMTTGELFLDRLGSPSRRVRCVHCRAMTDDVVATLVRCAGCGATLLVRDHFSRRLGAFMGVQADAEMPGEHPPPEPLAS